MMAVLMTTKCQYRTTSKLLCLLIFSPLLLKRSMWPHKTRQLTHLCASQMCVCSIYSSMCVCSVYSSCHVSSVYSSLRPSSFKLAWVKDEKEMIWQRSSRTSARERALPECERTRARPATCEREKDRPRDTYNKSLGTKWHIKQEPGHTYNKSLGTKWHITLEEAGSSVVLTLQLRGFHCFAHA